MVLGSILIENEMSAPMYKQDPTAEWKRLLARSIEAPQELTRWLGRDIALLKETVQRFPMRINPYYLGLIREIDDPIYKQCIPDPRELDTQKGLLDPLAEERYSPLPGLTHRYPDRVMFLVSDQCAVYCRFCNRKRKVGRQGVVTEQTIRNGLQYIKEHDEIRDVLLSGGDPLLLDTNQLEAILVQLREIPHVQIIRIGTRVPCTLPQRITPRLAQTISKFHPVYINTHFNHPAEITPQAAQACSLLADAGIPLGCQTVLLAGVNDDPETMRELTQRLLGIRVRPYYLFQCDQALGTAHFWTNPQKGLEIIAALVGHTSGLCVPHYCLDLPGGGGKVPLLPQYLQEGNETYLVVKNYEGKLWKYPIYPQKEQRERRGT